MDPSPIFLTECSLMAILSQHRQQSYVNRSLQGQLLRRLATYGLVYFLWLWHGLFLLDMLNPPQAWESQSFGQCYLNYCRENVRLAICAALILPWFFWDALKLSHRIAGPLERFRVSLEHLTKGESVDPVTLRRDDLLVDYQHAFNRYLAYLEEAKNTSG